MTAAGKWDNISVEDYLAAEEVADSKHEYVAGVVYAMAGAKNRHNRIATNATVALGSRLRGHPCDAFNSDTKVRIQTQIGTRFYYPDAMVVCDSNPEDDSFQDQPVTIVEVLSESPRRTDLGEKKDAYLTIPTLQSYLLLETDAPVAHFWQRDVDGAWQHQILDGAQTEIVLPEADLTVPLSDLYEGVEFSE